MSVKTETSRSTKRMWYTVCGALLLAAAVFLCWQKVQAADTISYDPYADSVTATSPIVSGPNNAVGGPNGGTASMAGVNASLTLDMGKGEEGTQTLKVYLGQIGAQANMTVAFLDGNQTLIASETRQLGVDLNASTQNFAYNWATYGKAYRYVRLSSAAGAGVNVDAVEALGYIGSTPAQDTDGDGIPDRQEQQNGTDPLVPNPAAGGQNNTGGSSSTLPRTTPAGGTSSGASGQVNPPPAGNNDQDGDGMPDDWEKAHGLNPQDKTDATKDPDHDELTNLVEYQIGSDPQKYDTDGDGMPDGWEYRHGLDVNKNDADGDPDGDFLTNLGEYRHNTDPQKADDLYKVFGKACSDKKFSAWDWVLFLALVAAAVIAGAKAMRAGAASGTQSTKNGKNSNSKVS